MRPSLLREPLVHFIAAGMVLFVAGKMYGREDDIHRITITPEREAHLAARYVMQFGAQPDAATLAQLVKLDIDEEILFRQGLRLQLDQGDEVVRRRIVQKMEFLLQDVNAPAEPSDAELHAYYEAHAARYRQPTRTTFSHVYFSAERAESVSRARATLEKLARGTDASELGDPFPELRFISGYEPEQVERVFGRSELTQAAFSGPLQQWFGPVKSGYGWHLMHIDAREEAHAQSFDKVRDRVRTDYLLAAQARANAAAFDDVAQEFTVVRNRW